jgi:hypothetical protein
VLKEAPDSSHFIPEETDHAPDTSGIIIYRFGAPLYFTNATFFEEEIEENGHASRHTCQMVCAGRGGDG